MYNISYSGDAREMARNQRTSIHRLVTILAAKANLPYNELSEVLQSVGLPEMNESSYRSELNSYVPRIFSSDHDYTLAEHVVKPRTWAQLK